MAKGKDSRPIDRGEHTFPCSVKNRRVVILKCAQHATNARHRHRIGLFRRRHGAKIALLDSKKEGRAIQHSTTKESYEKNKKNWRARCACVPRNRHGGLRSLGHCNRERRPRHRRKRILRRGKSCHRLYWGILEWPLKRHGDLTDMRLEGRQQPASRAPRARDGNHNQSVLRDVGR